MTVEDTLKRLQLKEPKVSPLEIQAFYQNNAPMLLRDSPRRQYRLLLRDYTMVALGRKITKPEQLQKLCVKLLPVAVYQTVSRWVFPEVLSNRGKPKHGGSRWTKNLFLDSDFIIDLDPKHCTQHNLTLLMETLAGYDTTIVRTGNGYHFWIWDWRKDRHFITKPFDREMKCKREMEKFVGSLKDKGIEFDYSISMDTRRIARVPNTLHQNGTVCKVIKAEELIQSFSSTNGGSPASLSIPSSR